MAIMADDTTADTDKPRSKSLMDLITLLTINKKRDLQKHCRSITILKSDFSSLILAGMTGALPWSHRVQHHEFIPDHLELTDEDLGAFAASGVGRMKPRAQKTANKIAAIFDERRLLSGHLFFNADHSNWHLFYFDQRDFADRSNHWKHGGSHIHLINWLWPNRSASETWSQFCNGNQQMRGALHIKFKQTERTPFVGPGDTPV
jgi:hypothetical protein